MKSFTALFILSCFVSSNAQSTFGSPQGITGSTDSPYRVYAADLDGDGDADILSASESDNKIAWYENQGGGTFGTQQIITTNAQYARNLYATDLDGDGDVDVLSASHSDDKIAWYENLGVNTATFGPQQVITTNADSARSVYATDLDGDGDADVLSASGYDDKIAWYENLGVNSGTFGPQQTITTSADAYSVYATDLDGDGDADVLSAVWDKIAWYENTGGGTFGNQQVITTSAQGAVSVYATDLDGDGDADVLSASMSDDKIAWYENLGPASPGSFGPQQVITTHGDGPRSVYATDLDGDGDADVLSASSWDDRIDWYENLTNYWRFSITETPSFELNFNFKNGQATTQYFAFYSLSPLNGTSPYSGGLVFGLHISLSDLLSQLMAGMGGDPIFGGVLDATGSAAAIYNQPGLAALTGMTVWGIALQAKPSPGGSYEASPITSLTFL